MAQQAAKPGRWPQYLPVVGVIAGFLLVIGPLLATVLRSLLVFEGDDARLSLDHFIRIFKDPAIHAALGNTLICGLATTFFSLILGFTLAWLVARTDMPGRQWFEVGNLIPFFLSPYVGAISWI